MNRRYNQGAMDRTYGFFHYLSAVIYDMAFRGRHCGFGESAQVRGFSHRLEPRQPPRPADHRQSGAETDVFLRPQDPVEAGPGHVVA